MPRSRVRGAVLVAVLVAAPEAAAHQAGLSQGVYSVDGRTVRADLVLARGEAAQVVPRADVDRDGLLSEVELMQVQDRLAGALIAGVKLFDGVDECPGAIDRVSFVEDDGLAFAAAFTCPAGQPLAAVNLRLPVLARLAPGHRHVGHVVFVGASAAPPGHAVDFVAHRGRPAWTIQRPTPEPVIAAAIAPELPPERSPWRSRAGLAGLIGLAGLTALRVHRARRRRPA